MKPLFFFSFFIVVINATSCEIKKLDSGEKYEVQVVAMSNKVESPEAKIIEQTMCMLYMLVIVLSEFKSFI